MIGLIASAETTKPGITTNSDFPIRTVFYANKKVASHEFPQPTSGLTPIGRSVFLSISIGIIICLIAIALIQKAKAIKAGKP